MECGLGKGLISHEFNYKLTICLGCVDLNKCNLSRRTVFVKVVETLCKGRPFVVLLVKGCSTWAKKIALWRRRSFRFCASCGLSFPPPPSSSADRGALYFQCRESCSLLVVESLSSFAVVVIWPLLFNRWVKIPCIAPSFSRQHTFFLTAAPL